MTQDLTWGTKWQHNLYIALLWMSHLWTAVNWCFRAYTSTLRGGLGGKSHSSPHPGRWMRNRLMAAPSRGGWETVLWQFLRTLPFLLYYRENHKTFTNTWVRLKTNSPTRKRAKNMTDMSPETTYRHMRRWSTWLVVRKIEIKATMWYDYTHHTWYLSESLIFFKKLICYKGISIINVHVPNNGFIIDKAELYRNGKIKKN